VFITVYLDHDGHLSDVSFKWRLSDAVDFPAAANHDTTTVRHSTLTTLTTHRQSHHRVTDWTTATQSHKLYNVIYLFI